MTWTETTERSSSQAPAAEVISPFAGTRVWEITEVPPAASAVGEANPEVTGEMAAEQPLTMETWAAEVFESAVTPFAHGAIAEDREVLVAELTTELSGSGLGEALGELVQEWSGIHAEHSSSGGIGETPQAQHEARQMLERTSEEIAAQTETMFESIVGELGDREVTTLTEQELAALFESLESPPIPQSASPAQEQFFKAIARVAGRVVRGAVNLVRKGVNLVGKVISAPLRFVFNGLAKLVRPLLRRVLTSAIERLPAALRPAADALRRRLFGAEVSGESNEFGEFNENSFGETGAVAGEHGGWVSEAAFLAELRDELPWQGELAAVGEMSALEQEYAALIARTMASENEQEAGQFEDEFTTTTAETEASPGAGELDSARITLIRELAELRPGESPGPAIERFLPVVIPILKIGLSLIGRRRVVNFLANLLAGLIRPLLGPQLAGPLSQIVVDQGLRIFGFETTPEDRELAAPSVIAGVLEDTVRRVAEQGETAFEDTNRLHTETVAAFNEAVAHGVPGSLVRGDLEDRETAGTDSSTWLLRPRVYWYRKYSRIFEVTLTPQMAQSITTFGGVRLSDTLRAQGVRLPVRVRVHLYETLPGTYLSRISTLERHVPGMGAEGWRRMHPLSINAASVLIGEPGLGKDVDRRFTTDRSTVAAGQRVFYLQLPGSSGGTPHIKHGRPTQAFVTLDGRPTQNRIRVLIYLSEADAQGIAARARTNNTTGFVLAMRAAVSAAVTSLRKSPGSRVTILRETAGEDEAAQAAAASLGSKIVEKIVDRLIDAGIRLATDYVRAKAAEFVTKVDDPADGVTVVITFGAPGLSTVLRGGVLPSIMQIGAIRTLLGSLASRGGGVQTFAGFRRF